MKNKKSLLSHAVKTGIFALTMFSAAQAQAESEPSILPIFDEMYAKADLNGDAQISPDEFYHLHTEAALMEFDATFKAMDNDGDGIVMAEEFVRFLSTMDESIAKERFMAAAGDNGMLEAEEFSVMRLKEQGANTDLLWQFALMDRDHDGQLAPHELFENHLGMVPPWTIDSPPEKPGVITDPDPEKPEVVILPFPEIPGPIIDPEFGKPGVTTDPNPEKPEVAIPEPIVDPEFGKPGVTTDPDPEKPEVAIPEPIVDPEFGEPGVTIQPFPEIPEPIVDPAPVEPPTNITLLDGTVITLPIDPDTFVGPLPPVVDPVETIITLDEELIKELQEKVDAMEAKIARLEKSIEMTKKRSEAVTSDKKLARLERRLQRQMDRLGNMQEHHQKLLETLDEAMQMRL